MDENEALAAMYVDLMTTEMRVVAERHALTQRALLYLRVDGFTVEQVCDALKVGKSTWYRRVAELREFQAGNAAAAERLERQRASRAEGVVANRHRPVTSTALIPAGAYAWQGEKSE